MISVGDVWVNETELAPYEVVRIICPFHGRLESCRASLIREHRGVLDHGVMRTLCPKCPRAVEVIVQQIPRNDPRLEKLRVQSTSGLCPVCLGLGRERPCPNCGKVQP